MDNIYIIIGETGDFSDKKTEIIGITDNLNLAEDMIKKCKQDEEDYIQKVNNFMNDKIEKDKIKLSIEKFNKKYRYCWFDIESKDKITKYNHRIIKTRFNIKKKKINSCKFEIKDYFDFNEDSYSESELGLNGNLSNSDSDSELDKSPKVSDW